MTGMVLEDCRTLYDQQKQIVKQVNLEQQIYLRLVTVLCVLRQAQIILDQMFFVALNEQVDRN